MKTKINVPVLLIFVGIINLIFLLDSILTDPNEEFTVFSISSSKTFNIIYYLVLGTVSIGIGMYFLKRTNLKRKIKNDRI